MGLDNPIHIAFLLILLLLVFGAKRLPEMGKSLGSGMRGFKDALGGEEHHTPLAAHEQPATVAPVAAAQQPAASVAADPQPAAPAAAVADPQLAAPQPLAEKLPA
jgi:sec-independent protein translocase protein TatA